MSTEAERISRALEFAKDGTHDGDHHKMWAIDQMVRALTGCPMVQRSKTDVRGNPYTYEEQGESNEYEAWVAAFEEGPDGPETYSWDTGIAP